LPKPNPQIPASFRRAAKRASLLRWVIRIAGTLLAICIVAAVIFVFLLPGLARKRARERLEAAGLDASFEIMDISHRGLFLKNLKFGDSPGDLAVGELEASFTFGELRKGRVREVRLRGMSGLAGLHGARWTFGGLERLAALARKGYAETAEADESLTVERVIVEDGILDLRLPGLPSMTLPFALDAHLREGTDIYEFAATLSPGSNPLQVSGELNPFTGGGRLAAQAKALELNEWTQYLLLDRQASCRLVDLSAKTDLQISTIFETFVLVWAHIDCELAGLDATLEIRSPEGAIGSPARGTAHSAHLVFDILSDENSPRPRLDAAIRLTQGHLDLDGDGRHLSLSELDATGSINWGPDGRPRYAAGGKLAGFGLREPGGTLASDLVEFSIPPFLSLDAMRWQAESLDATAEAGTVAFKAADLTAKGTIDDALVDIGDLSFSRETVSGSARLSLAITPRHGDTVKGKGTMTALSLAGRPILAAPHDFALIHPRGKDTLVTAPKLSTLLLPEAEATDLRLSLDLAETDVGYELVTKAVLPPSLLLAGFGIACTEGDEVNVVFTSKGRWDRKQVRAETRLGFPAQDLLCAGSGWKLSSRIEGNVQFRSGTREDIELAGRLDRFRLKIGERTLSWKQLALDGLRVSPVGRTRLADALLEGPDLDRLRIAGGGDMPGN